MTALYSDYRNKEDDVHRPYAIWVWIGCVMGLVAGIAWGAGVVASQAAAQGNKLATMQMQADERLVLAFYYAWFDWDTWSQSTCGQPDTLYVSADASAIERHARLAHTAGIDGLVQAWYGPGLAQNPTEPNFQTLLEKAEQENIQAAVLVDMTGALLSTTDAVVDALTKVRDDHGQHPAYLTMDGRPVLFFLGQDAFSLPTWEAIRNNTDPDHTMIWIAADGDVAALEIFDGLYLHNIAEADEPAPLLMDWSGRVRFWALEHATQRYWVATVMPGYDDTATASEDEALLRSRRAGAYYRETWDAAEATDPDWIVIRSLNGWRTCTQIEPSEAEGDAYMDLTTELIAQYGEVVPPTETPTPTGTSMVVVTPTATLSPVTPTITPTLTPSPTPWLTPTITLTPSPTPFRLATPTPLPGQGTLVVAPTVAPEGESGEEPSVPGDNPAVPGAYATPTPTQIPRLPVEGAPPRRCSLLPLLLPLGAAVVARRRRRQSKMVSVIRK